MGFKLRVIHRVSTESFAHPFKVLTICKRMIRFGGTETEDRKVTCKQCLKVIENENNKST